MSARNRIHVGESCDRNLIAISQRLRTFRHRLYLKHFAIGLRLDSTSRRNPMSFSTVSRIQSVIESAERLLIIVNLVLPTLTMDLQVLDAMNGEVEDLNRVVQKVKGKLASGLTASHAATVEEFVLGTMQAITSRMLSGESGQISVQLGVVESA